MVGCGRALEVDLESSRLGQHSVGQEQVSCVCAVKRGLLPVHSPDLLLLGVQT